MHLIKNDNMLNAWQCCVRHLCSRPSSEEFNLIVVISNPDDIQKSWLEGYNPSKYDRTCNVVNTIFPYKYIDEDEETVYKKYMTIHQEAQKRKPRNKRWGTYFERMISFRPFAQSYGQSINQLQCIISSIKESKNNHKATYVIHISSPYLDSINKIMGNPCLQYLEFLCPDKKTISLLAVYRNHDYYKKAIGNFIGLGYLLRFVCKHTNRDPGELICHSAHAYIKGKSKARHFIE